LAGCRGWVLVKLYLGLKGRFYLGLRSHVDGVLVMFPTRLECRAGSVGARGAAAGLWRLLAATAAILAIAAAGPALAGGPVSAVSTNGVGLVRGGAPLPDFQIDFLSDLGTSPLALPRANTGDLDIALTSPDHSVLHFLFSPRPQFGFSLDKDTGTTRGYAGLSWNVFGFSGISGNLGLAGSVTQSGPEDPNRRLLGPPLALHSTFELGYQFGSQDSLSLSLDHATTPDFLNEHGDINNIHLRYGLHF